jgi:hypothetical protein
MLFTVISPLPATSFAEALVRQITAALVLE